jgi:hypothetical protein
MYDYVFTKDELKKSNLPNNFTINKDGQIEMLPGLEYDKKFVEKKDRCYNGSCLSSANNFFDMFTKPLGISNSWQEKENAGITSGSKNKDYGDSADSWDIHGLLQEKGGKQVLAADLKDHMNIQRSINKMNPKQREDYFKSMDLPIGSIISYGDKGILKSSDKKSYNNKKGLVASNHSTRVIGYDERGVPVTYDMGLIKTLDDGSWSDAGLTNITIPKEHLQNTRDKLAQDGKLYNPYSDIDINYRGNTNVGSEFNPFNKALSKNKEKLSRIMGIDNDKYNELSKQAAALALEETKGGSLFNTRKVAIPSYLLD